MRVHLGTRLYLYTPICHTSMHPDVGHVHVHSVGLPESNVTVLLVSDPITESSGAAVAVATGFLNDPQELLGLSHFLEHLLFQGSEKYPGEDEYMKFLSERGGFANAYTTTDSTNYFFQVQHAHLAGALDIFAQFFIAPLFLEGSVDREIDAVNSEHMQGTQNDGYRMHYLTVKAITSHHRVSRFGTGNWDTLQTQPKAAGVNVRDELMKYHSARYSGNIMSLVVYGRESLDELEQFVKTSFDGVKDQQLPRDITHGDGPAHEDLDFAVSSVAGHLIKAVPIKEVRYLTINIPLPSLLGKQDDGLTDMLAELLGHEAPGSILHSLKERELANDLSVGVDMLASDFCTIELKIKLTALGLEQWTTVVDTLAAYTTLLKEVTVTLYDEFKQLAANRFEYRDRVAPHDFVCSTAGAMLTWSPELVLSKHLSYKGGFDQEKWNALVACVQRVDRFMFVLYAKEFEGNTEQECEWTGAPYTLGRVDATLVAQWAQTVQAGSGTDEEGKPKLHLPLPNAFIPTDFSVLKEKVMPDLDAPYLIPVPSYVKNEKTGTVVWNHIDDSFGLPLSRVMIVVRFEPVKSTRFCMLVSLYADMVTEMLKEISYYAEVADSVTQVVAESGGIRFSLNGFSEKIPALLDATLKYCTCTKKDGEGSAATCEIAPRAVFDRVMDRKLRALKSFLVGASYRRTQRALSLLMFTDGAPAEKRLRVLETISYEDVNAFAAQLVSAVGTHVEVIACGNTRVEEAAEFAKKTLSVFKGPNVPQSVTLSHRGADFGRCPSKTTSARMTKISFDHPSPTNGNHAFEYTVWLGALGVEERAKLFLFNIMVNERFFEELRTAQQLGYVVMAHSDRRHGVGLYSFKIQSTVESTSGLCKRITGFLTDTYYKELKEMEDDAFAQFVDGATTALKERPENGKREAGRIQSAIRSLEYSFHRNKELVAILDGLKLSDMIEWYEKNLLPVVKKEGDEGAVSSVHVPMPVFMAACDAAVPPSGARMTYDDGSAIPMGFSVEDTDKSTGTVEAVSYGDEATFLLRQRLLPVFVPDVHFVDPTTVIGKDNALDASTLF